MKKISKINVGLGEPLVRLYGIRKKQYSKPCKCSLDKELSLSFFQNPLEGVIFCPSFLGDLERFYFCEADKSEISHAIVMLKALQKENCLNIEAVTGDAIYGSEDILKFIVKELEAKAVIPRNPGNNRKAEFYFKERTLYCPADIPMMKKGKMTVKGITYLQYRCPIHWSKRIGQRYLLCPTNHPKFFSQKGCNYLIRLTPSIREEIDYETEDFGSMYSRRTSIERVFSSLLSIAMQNPEVTRLNATQNHCSIAHITVLL